MGHAKRQYNATITRFKRQLKKPIKNTLATMSEGFSFNEFAGEFKNLYSYLWDDICSKYKSYNFKDDELVKRGFRRRYNFPKPKTFLYEVAAPYIRNKSYPSGLTPEEKTKLRDDLKKKCEDKQQARKRKQEEKLKYKQTVNPKYSNYYIDTYFEAKRHNPTDVDTRYAILVEAAKYKSPETTKFLCKVNASERNYYLRQFAFCTLQDFGEQEVKLKRNPKGKKKPGDDVVPKPINTPEELINSIYNSQLEKRKMFDVFLSHSSRDIELLLRLKAILNHSNLNVYIDWVNDKEALQREKTSVNTANVIIERLKASTALLYVHTTASFNSQWTPWELGYFHSLKNKICVYAPDDIKKPPFIEIYPTVELKNSTLYVKVDDVLIDFKEWLNQ